MIGIDFETYLISENQPWPKPVCLSYHTDQVTGLAIGFKEMEEALNWAFSTKKPIIAHNAMFECGVIFTWFPALKDQLITALDEGRVICTKINQQLIDNYSEKSVKYSLADLVMHYFNEDISEDKKDPNAWRLRYNELDGVPKEKWPKKAIEYAIDDSIWAYKVFTVQDKPYIKECVQAEVWLNMMATFGITVDVERSTLLEKEIRDIIVPTYKDLTSQGFCTELLKGIKYKKNMKALREHIEKNVKEVEYTAKKTVSTTNKSLSKYSVTDEISKKFMSLSEYEKVISAYTANLKKPLIRTVYSAAMATGRTSSSKSRAFPSVNIQQMPRSVNNVTWDVRNCFIPREGFKIVSIDYNGLELASAAHQLYSTLGYSELNNVVNSGSEPVDMHSRLACQIMSNNLNKKVTYDEFVQRKKEKEYAVYRQLSKPINLGFPGGIGYRKMRLSLARDGIFTKYGILETVKSESAANKLYRMCRNEKNVRIERIAKNEYALVYDELIELKQNLFQLYPDLEEFLKETHKKFLTGKTKYVQNDFGEWEEEPVYSYEINKFKRDYATYTALCNGYLMQTPASLGAKRAMCDIIKEYYWHSDVNPLAFIHDEILFEVRDNEERFSYIEDIANRLISQMQSVLPSVRIAVEAEIMPYWMKAGGEWSMTYWKDAGSDSLKSVQ